MCDISALIDLLEGHANTIKSKMTAEQRAVVDTMIMIERIRLSPDRALAGNLRGMAMQYGQSSMPLLCAYMDVLADKIDKPNQLKL